MYSLRKRSSIDSDQAQAKVGTLNEDCNVLFSGRSKRDPTVPRKKSRISEVWASFEIIRDDASKAQCNLCKRQVAYNGKRQVAKGASGRSGTTSNLWKHLQISHSEVFQTAKKVKSELMLK